MTLRDARISRLVSVVIPTYNRAGLLAECLASVFAQTYRPLEVIVADDGSTDDTPGVVADFRERTEAGTGWSVIHLPLEHGGAPRARNAGVARAKGAFVNYLDSDDLLHCRKVELQVAAFERYPEAEFVWSPYVYFDRERPKDVAVQAPRLLAEARCVRARRWGDVPGMVPIGLLRRSLCERLGPWNEALLRWQDIEYLKRFGQGTAVRLGAPLYYIRRHTAGQIQDLYRRQEGLRAGFAALAVIERNVGVIPSADPDLRISMANFYKSLAETALECGCPADFRAALAKAVQHRPDWRFRLRALALRCARALAGSAAALSLLRQHHRARRADIGECFD